MSNDTIEREIFIRAGIDRVWSLVSKAGFWIGDDLRFDHDAREGERVAIDSEKYGSFPVLVDRLDAPHYAAYRWASGSPGNDPTDENSTLVEFTLSEQDGGVLLRLRESGFAALPGGSDLHADNVEGWAQQLERLRQVAGETVTT